MLHSFGQVRATMLRPGMRSSSIFCMSQHIATGWPNARKLRYVVLICCDRLAGACKCWANNVTICCVDMLRSFGRGFSYMCILLFFRILWVHGRSVCLLVKMHCHVVRAL